MCGKQGSSVGAVGVEGSNTRGKRLEWRGGARSDAGGPLPCTCSRRWRGHVPCPDVRMLAMPIYIYIYIYNDSVRASDGRTFFLLFCLLGQATGLWPSQLLQNIFPLRFVAATSIESSVHNGRLHHAIRPSRPRRAIRPHPLCLTATAILGCTPCRVAPVPILGHAPISPCLSRLWRSLPYCHEEVAAGAPALGCMLCRCSRRPPDPRLLVTAVPHQVCHGCR
jgi:hypothetical protein